VRAKVNGPNRTSLLDWAFPVVAGAIFAVLFIVANPVVTAWFDNISVCQRAYARAGHRMGIGRHHHLAAA
jgi:hypothetical protein